MVAPARPSADAQPDRARPRRGRGAGESNRGDRQPRRPLRLAASECHPRAGKPGQSGRLARGAFRDRPHVGPRRIGLRLCGGPPFADRRPGASRIAPRGFSLPVGRGARATACGSVDAGALAAAGAPADAGAAEKERTSRAAVFPDHLVKPTRSVGVESL